MRSVVGEGKEEFYFFNVTCIDCIDLSAVQALKDLYCIGSMNLVMFR